MLVHVLASGPSIREYMTAGWPKEKTIGCNGVGLLHPGLDAWCACDLMPAPVIDWATKFMGKKFVSSVNQHQFPGACVCKHWSSHGPLPFNDAVIHGYYWHGSVAMLGCELARIVMDATDIFVHGLDYHDQEHAYDHLDKRLERHEKFWDMQLLERNWRNMFQSYKSMGVSLWNANRRSALQALPKMENWRRGVPVPEMRAV